MAAGHRRLLHAGVLVAGLLAQRVACAALGLCKVSGKGLFVDLLLVLAQGVDALRASQAQGAGHALQLFHGAFEQGAAGAENGEHGGPS